MWILVLERILLDFILHLVYFPLWWYTGGIRYAAMFGARQVSWMNGYLVPGLWLKNIFVPMFGQNDWQGRIVSFFIRLANVIVRFFMLAVWVLFVTLICLLWPMLPIAVSYLFFASL